MIHLSDLKTGPAPEDEKFVLVAYVEDHRPDIMSRWFTCMPGFYNYVGREKHFVGWMSLKDLPPMQTSLPEKIFYEDGAINSVLTKFKEVRCSNPEYLSEWNMCNTEYYHLHPDEFHGWIEVEKG